MTDYILDTNICVFHLRGKINLAEIQIEKKAALHISEVTVLELYYGAEKSLKSKNNFEKIADMLQDISVLPINKYYRNYASERAYLEKLGKPLHDDFDLLIGVTAVAENFILVTDNSKHFRNVRNLKTENWITR